MGAATSRSGLVQQYVEPMHRRVRATPRPAGRDRRAQAPRLGECGQRRRRGNPLEVIRGVWRLDRQRVPFGDGAAELASPVAIGALAGSGLRGGVVRGVMRGLGGGGRGIERPGGAGADHPANRHRDGQNRCQPRMPAFHNPTNTPCPPPGQVRAFPRNEGAPPSIGTPRFGFEGKVPSLRAFPGARAPRPRLGLPGSVSRAGCPRSVRFPRSEGAPPSIGNPAFSFEGKLPSLRAFPGARAPRPRLGLPRSVSRASCPRSARFLERGRPALDWDSRVQFRGQVALAPGVSWSEGAPPSIGSPRFGFEGKVPSLRAFPRSEGAPPSIGSPRFGFEGKVPLLRAFPGARAPRPRLGLPGSVSRARCPRSARFPERGRPALDWGSRVRFRGQVALAQRVSRSEGAPPSIGDPRFGFEGKLPSLRAFPRSEGAPPSIGTPGFGFEGKVPSLRAFPNLSAAFD